MSALQAVRITRIVALYWAAEAAEQRSVVVGEYDGDDSGSIERFYACARTEDEAIRAGQWELSLRPIVEIATLADH